MRNLDLFVKKEIRNQTKMLKVASRLLHQRWCARHSGGGAWIQGALASSAPVRGRPLLKGKSLSLFSPLSFFLLQGQQPASALSASTLPSQVQLFFPFDFVCVAELHLTGIGRPFCVA